MQTYTQANVLIYIHKQTNKQTLQNIRCISGRTASRAHGDTIEMEEEAASSRPNSLGVIAMSPQQTHSLACSSVLPLDVLYAVVNSCSFQVVEVRDRGGKGDRRGDYTAIDAHVHVDTVMCVYPHACIYTCGCAPTVWVHTPMCILRHTHVYLQHVYQYTKKTCSYAGCAPRARAGATSS